MDFLIKHISNILLGIIAIALSIIAVKITFAFNINDYLKRKDDRLKSKIKNYCTHMSLFNHDGKIAAKSYFCSPPGTNNWICERCGLQLFSLDQKDEQIRMEYFLKNVKKYKQQEKKFKKLAKKLGIF